MKVRMFAGLTLLLVSASTPALYAKERILHEPGRGIHDTTDFWI
jgi:hypothetical protein